MKKALVSSVLLLLLLGVATGCSRYYWSKSGASAEQFTRDNQACVQQAAGTLPASASLDTVRQYYRGCLNSRGYVRDKQMDPPPPGSYRGIENSEEFNAAVQAAMVPGVSADLRAAAGPARRPEGARADHRGRVRHDAQAPGGGRDPRRARPRAARPAARGRDNAAPLTGRPLVRA